MFWYFASIALEPATVQPELLVPTVGNSTLLQLLSRCHFCFSYSPPRHECSCTTISFYASTHVSYLGLKSLQIGNFWKNPVCLFKGGLWPWTQLPDSPQTLCLFHHMYLCVEKTIYSFSDRDFCAHPRLDKWQNFIPVPWLSFHCFIHSTCKTFSLLKSCIK